MAATPTETPAVHAHVLRFLAEPRGCAARGDLRHGRHWCRTAALLPGQMSVRTEAVAGGSRQAWIREKRGERDGVAHAWSALAASRGRPKGVGGGSRVRPSIAPPSPVRCGTSQSFQSPARKLLAAVMDLILAGYVARSATCRRADGTKTFLSLREIERRGTMASCRIMQFCGRAKR